MKPCQRREASGRMKIFIPTPLRQYVDGQDSVDVPARTVSEALGNLVAGHPALQKHLFGEDGRLRAFVNLYLNDEDVRYLARDATAVKESDTLSIVPSIAGGAAIALGRTGTTGGNGAVALSNDEILRYSRHLIMPEVGMEGQQRLKAARVLCVGAGGLGSPLTAGSARAAQGRSSSCARPASAR
jgi:sulfur-carrier protein adenylyltransferase/sulfurtransferase